VSPWFKELGVAFRPLAQVTGVYDNHV